MINPLDYLYYKIYKTWSFFEGGDYPIFHHGVTTVLLSCNVYSIHSWIFKHEFSTPIFMIYLIPISIFISVRYRTKYEDQVIAKFKRESETSRIIGNLAVILYAVLTIWAFGLVSLD